MKGAMNHPMIRHRLMIGQVRMRQRRRGIHRNPILPEEQHQPDRGGYHPAPQLESLESGAQYENGEDDADRRCQRRGIRIREEMNRSVNPEDRQGFQGLSERIYQ